ncbi:MAG: hypothetical protein R3312_02955 [Gammaproteobacteria bacterium]|nr:hypothetical protein [Gammaproteobacteria bacterium]
MHMAIYDNLASSISMRLAGVSLTLLLLAGCQGGSTEDTGPDAGIIDYPIAYVKHPYAVDEDTGEVIQPDLTDPLYFAEGGDLYIRSRSSLSGTETNITSAVTGGQGDVKDVDVSFDGTKLIFSLRLFDPNPNTPPTPRWNLYEYDIPTQQLSKLMDDVIAEQGDDVDPHYLPDGSIVFSSNRQATAKAILLREDPALNKQAFSALDEDEDVQAMVLHTVDADGTNGSIRQISFNQSHDLDPVVLNNGWILFSRWDNAGPGNGGVNLYKIRPDGTELGLVYGPESHDSGTNGVDIQFIQARALPNGNAMGLVMPFNEDAVNQANPAGGGTFGGGDIVYINFSNSLDDAHSPATVNAVTTDGSLSPGGRYASFYPLYDGSNRMLVSKGFCRIEISGVERACIEPYVSDPAAIELPSDYSIWMYDLVGDAEKPVVPAEPGIRITDVVVGSQSRAYPPVADNATLDPVLESEQVGMLHIRSVYDFDGTFNNLSNFTVNATSNLSEMASSLLTTADQRPARFLRLVKNVSIPDPDDEITPGLPDLDGTAFGPNRRLGMREILGYAPVEPDGSVMIKVPADVPFTIEVLDAEGRRIGARHDNWLQLSAGETRQCNGCHNPASGLPHGREDLDPTPVNQGAGLPAGTPSLPWPMPASLGTVPALYAVTGETMAEARYNRCVTDLACATLPVAAANFNPSVDVLYEDVWTDSSVATVNLADSMKAYAELQLAGEIFETVAPPVYPSTCLTAWENVNYTCRTVINYPAHIHPLWAKDRGANTCTNCHSTRVNDDPMDAIQVPAGQLNLSDNNLVDDATIVSNGQEHAYRELLFTDTELELDGMGGLQEVLVDVDTGQLDINGLPIIIQVPVNVGPSMSSNGARVSYFFEKLNNTELNAGRGLSGTTDHSGFMTAAELRLVAEWLDIGAQYYNNPFDPNVPTN